MSQNLVTKFIAGGRLTYKLLGAEDGLKLGMMLMEKPFNAVVNAEGTNIDISPEDVLYLLTSFDEQECAELIATLLDGATLNNAPLDPDEDFAANYSLMLTCLHEVFIANFGVFFAFVMKPFQRAEIVLDDGGMSQRLAPVKTKAQLEDMAKLDNITEIMQCVYFSKLHNETWMSLKQMPLADFWLLKTGIDVREAIKQEVDTNQFNEQKRAHERAKYK
ncbi:hypothetical protein OYT40_002165 [Escherichia coli]|nr:hypothetical protein [Escherichia coli]